MEDPNVYNSAETSVPSPKTGSVSLVPNTTPGEDNFANHDPTNVGGQDGRPNASQMSSQQENASTADNHPDAPAAPDRRNETRDRVLAFAPQNAEMLLYAEALSQIKPHATIKKQLRSRQVEVPTPGFIDQEQFPQ